MPITSSAKKALRQDARRGKQNARVKENVKRILKQVRDLVAQKKTGEVAQLLPRLYKILDKASNVGVIKKNTASRKKSRITKLLKSAA